MGKTFEGVADSFKLSDTKSSIFFRRSSEIICFYYVNAVETDPDVSIQFE